MHSLLCSKEEEIEIVLEKVQEQGYNTAKTWIQKGVQWFGGMLVTTAIRVSVVLVMRIMLTVFLSSGRRRAGAAAQEELQLY